MVEQEDYLDFEDIPETETAKNKDQGGIKGG